MAKWYRIENKGERAEIWIYEQIGEDWWTGGGITAKAFQKELAAIKASQIDLHINSPGGEVFDGITIYNLIKQHTAHVTTYIDGWAASIASIVALAGDKVVMAENAFYMIHNPRGVPKDFDEPTLRSMCDTLSKVKDNLVNVYMTRSSGTEEEIRKWMDDTTWFNAEEALAAGFIDEISVRMDLAACAKFIPIAKKQKFKNIPEDFKGPDPRKIERFLKEQGCSTTQAKAMIAEGFKDGQRDVDDPKKPLEDNGQRDVDGCSAKKRDRIADLLIRAEKMAPSRN